MQEIVREYGKFIVTGLVTLAALFWVSFYGLYREDGVEDTYVNATTPQWDTVGANDVKIRCVGALRLGEFTKVEDLFLAEDTKVGAHTTYPVVVTNVVDERGIGLQEISERVVCEKDAVVVNQAGTYQFYVKALPCQKTEVFTICVTDKEGI